MSLRVTGIVLAGLLLPCAGLSQDFKCPEGAKDPAGAVPNQIVRWCELQKDGRLLYHGPVWRWHRNGQLMSKENYVFGDMDGEVPSWWENGKQSSLGTYRSGKRVGQWRFWDEEGRIKFDVVYGDKAVVQDEYYPSGKKRATGAFNAGAKLGLWVYFDADGSEKARCDFGEGLFALPKDPGCKIIADELEPKGFSRPVPKAVVAQDGSAVVRIGPQVFAFTTPPEWSADADEGAGEQIPLVFFPKGTGWRKSPRNMYLRPLYTDGKPVAEIIAREKASFAANVAELKEVPLKPGKLSSGRPYFASSFIYKPVMATDSPFSIVQSNVIHEAIVYLDASPEVVLMIVLACESKDQFEASLPSTMAVVASLRGPTASRSR